MVVAIPVNEDEKTICVSFARAPGFLLYDTVTKEQKVKENPAAKAAGGAGILAAQFIVDAKVEAVLTPRCGENSAKVLDGASIPIYKTKSNNVVQEIKDYEEGKAERLTEIHAGFHHHSFDS